MSAKYKMFIVFNNFKQFRTITNSNKPKGVFKNPKDFLEFSSTYKYNWQWQGLFYFG